MNNNNLKEISDTTEKKRQLAWGSFNPDTSKVFFSKNYNLYWMDYANYQKALKDEKDSTIVEHQITSDGVQYYAWGSEPYSVTTGDKKSEDEEKQKRKSVWLNWSPNGQHFAIGRKDNRNHALWVINNVGGKRPSLETYKYLMPGETDSTETELYVFQANELKPRKIEVQAFKNQTLTLWNKDRSKESMKGPYFINYWHGNNEEFYIARSSRDLKRIDVLAVNVNGQVRTLVEERSNVYL